MDDHIPKLILTTMVEDVEVEYHVPMDQVSDSYQKVMAGFELKTAKGRPEPEKGPNKRASRSSLISSPSPGGG